MQVKIIRTIFPGSEDQWYTLKFPTGEVHPFDHYSSVENDALEDEAVNYVAELTKRVSSWQTEQRDRCKMASADLEITDEEARTIRAYTSQLEDRAWEFVLGRTGS